MALCAPLVAQEGADVQRRLLELFRGIEDPKASGFADLQAVFDGLTAIQPRLVDLPEARRDKARFFVGVRRSEVCLRQRRLEQAATIGMAARAEARARGVWQGNYYRVLSLVVLEQCLDDAAFDVVLDEERDYLGSSEPEDDLASIRRRQPGYLEIPLALLRTSLAARDGRDAEAMNSLGDLAARCLEERPQSDPWRIKVLARMVWARLVRGDLAGAEVYLAKLPVSYARYPRGLIAIRRGDYELARKAGRSLVRTGRKRHGYMLQGEALERAGRFDEALPIYRALLDLADSGIDRALALRSLGECELERFRDSGDETQRDAAERHLRAALEVESGGRHEAAETAQILASLGECLELAGEVDDSLSLYLAALERIDATRRTVAGDPFGRSWLVDGHLEGIDGVLRCAAAGRVSPLAALAAMEFGKARTLLDWTAGLGPVEAGLASVVRGLVLTDDPQDLERQLVGLRQALSPLSEQPSVAILDEAGVRAQADQLVLSYWSGSRRCWLVWCAGDRGGVVDLGSTSDALARCGAAWRAAASDAEPWADLDAAAAFFLPTSVRRAVERADRLVFCPDAELGRLPFEALRIGERSLGLVLPIERTPSLSVRARLAARARLGSGAAVVHSVVAPDIERQLGLDPLAWSAREAILVTSCYPEAVECSGDEATLAGVSALLESGPFDVVHVSAHAVDNPYLPTRSSLVLSDGPVTAPQLAGVGLEGAVLVLSACSTGGGEVRGGEGEIGLLGWACAGGARGAVASSWPVEQQATSDLMAQFHAARIAGLDCASAMMEARRTIAASPNYSHPRYWAGFGVWVPEPNTRADWVPWLLLIAGLGCAAFALISPRAAGLRRRSAAAAPR